MITTVSKKPAVLCKIYRLPTNHNSTYDSDQRRYCAFSLKSIYTLYLQRDKTVLLAENVWRVFFRRSRPRLGIIFKFPQYLPISTLELSLLARFLFHLWFSSAGVEIYIRVLDCKKLHEKLVHARLISFIPTSTLFLPLLFLFSCPTPLRSFRFVFLVVVFGISSPITCKSTNERRAKRSDFEQMSELVEAVREYTWIRLFHERTFPASCRKLG